MARRHKEVLTYRHFATMSYDELHKTLKEMLGQAGRLTRWFSAVERVNLLPALQAMHDKIAQPGRRVPDPDKPNWDDWCRSVGLSPTIVRMWRMRTAANTDIRHLLGEEPVQKAKFTQEQKNREAVKHLRLLCTEVLNGSEETAEQLALTLAERYGF
jgi:hypothetical protein